MTAGSKVPQPATRIRIPACERDACVSNASSAPSPLRGSAGWRGRRTKTVVTQVAQGTLVIDLRDASKRELVWRAVVNEREPNPAKLQDKLDNMVKKAAEKFPPKK